MVTGVTYCGWVPVRVAGVACCGVGGEGRWPRDWRTEVKGCALA